MRMEDRKIPLVALAYLTNRSLTSASPDAAFELALGKLLQACRKDEME